MQESPFPLDRDPALERGLRDLLGDGADAGFAARVVAGLPARNSLLHVLAGWARPGIAAALLLATALGVWLTLRAEAGAGVSPLAEVGASGRPQDSDALMGVALGGGR
ncbi:MAG: hypothetical protein IPI38_07330 [Gemmatimonadetes bacterium]|nr:hypothetical protein [Gemmatimonadota bacterium]MBK7715220.1 hypothetical protein [Gemmatimonadota bacterium]MBK7922763.1 hypothetical protein [Gemmatimonadota bacterium]MBK9690764.1 hypothetical protein [Gemmatimonadota bacterium]MBP9198610.1 hypothetical protein [Gemmatimonadales bacterium]